MRLNLAFHAALKAALLFHTAVVFDKGRKHSRVFFAPKLDNHIVLES